MGKAERLIREVKGLLRRCEEYRGDRRKTEEILPDKSYPHCSGQPPDNCIGCRVEVLVDCPYWWNNQQKRRVA